MADVSDEIRRHMRARFVAAGLNAQSCACAPSEPGTDSIYHIPPSQVQRFGARCNVGKQTCSQPAASSATFLQQASLAVPETPARPSRNKLNQPAADHAGTAIEIPSTCGTSSHATPTAQDNRVDLCATDSIPPRARECEADNWQLDTDGIEIVPDRMPPARSLQRGRVEIASELAELGLPDDILSSTARCANTRRSVVHAQLTLQNCHSRNEGNMPRWLHLFVKTRHFSCACAEGVWLDRALGASAMGLFPVSRFASQCQCCSGV